MSERESDETDETVEGRRSDSPARERPTQALPAPDPLDRIYALGERGGKTGGAVGLVLACCSHVVALFCAIALFQGSRALAATPTEIEIEITQPPAPPPPTPPPPPVAEPPPEPAPAPPPLKEDKSDPYEDNDLPPPPAEAAKVLTAPSEPDEPPAPADQTFASGEGTGLSVGLVAGAGTGNATTYDARARVGNKVPTRRPSEAPAVQGPDLSRSASPFYGMASGCEFPDGVDGETAVVPVIVTVGPNGQALSVQVLADPGQGFGPAARKCAMNHKYRAGRDAAGKPIVSKTPPVRVRFTR